MIERQAGQPLVSVLLVIFNQERYIEEALAACLAQDYLPLEIIVSDDFSTDSTFDIAKGIAASYSGPHRLIINRNTRNLGIGANVNAAFAMSSGDWIVLAAGDDISYPQRISELQASAKACAGERPLICSANRYIDGDGQQLHEMGISNLFSPHEENPVRWARALGPIHRGATFMFRRDLIEKFGNLRRDLVNEDQALTFRATLMGGWHFIPEPLVWYRVHDANTHGMRTAGRDPAQILFFKSVRAFRLVQVARQMSLDANRAYRLGLISGSAMRQLKLIARARLTDSMLDVKFYRAAMHGATGERLTHKSWLRRLARLRHMQGGGRKSVVHVIRGLAPGLTTALVCRRAARREGK